MKIKFLKSVTILSFLAIGCHGQNQTSHDITFKAGKVIEIAFATVEGGKEAQLGNDYFPKILPLAAKYNGKMLGSFQVVAVTGGSLQPQMVAIFEWSKTSDREKLLKDTEAQKLFPIRDDALTSLKLAYYTVDEDVTVSFRADKTYEFFNAWLTPESETSLPKYFELSARPKEKYGPPRFLANLKPYTSYLNGEPYVLDSQMAGIVEWNNVASFYGLQADPEFMKITYLLEESVSRLDMIQTRVNVPQ